MKLLLLIIFCFFSVNIVCSQTIDSTGHVITIPAPVLTKAANDILEEDIDDFSCGQALLISMALGFVLLCVGVGIAFTIIGLLILFGFVSAGIISASVIVGIYKKSFAKGFKIFLVSMSSAGGLFIFALTFWLLNKIVHWWSWQLSIIIGACLGVSIGFLFGLLAFYVLQKLTSYLKRLLNA